MLKYPKMETLFVRDEKFKVTDEIRCPEFANIKEWLVTEKIDGTNIRIIYTTEGKVLIRGRTDVAQIPKFLLKELKRIFTVDKFKLIFPEALEVDVILFGEGYGQKIQKGGGNYNKGNSFRLFDVLIGSIWLKWVDIGDIAFKLGIKTVPIVGIMNITDIIELVKKSCKGSSDCKLYSRVAFDEANKKILAEGIVARSYPLMLFRNRKPIKFKLKVKDFGKE